MIWWTLAMAETPPLEALDALVEGDLLVLVTADGTSLRGIAVDSGEERWKVDLGGPVQAAVIHDLGAGRLLLQGPTRYTTVEAATGAVLAERAAPGEWTFVHKGMGGCALRSECALSPVDCADGRALGPPLRSDVQWNHFYESDEDGLHHSESPRCIGQFEVLGAAAGMSLYRAGSQLIALDASGAERWRRTAPDCIGCSALGQGIAPDGSLAWIVSQEEGVATVKAFSASTGETAFESHLNLDPKTVYEGLVTGWIPNPPGILVVSRGQVTAFTPAGKTRWARKIPADVLPVPTGLRVPSFPLELSPFRVIERADPATGAVLAREPVAEGREVRVDEGVVEVVAAGTTWTRGGARVPAPTVATFVRDAAGSRLVASKKTVLQLPGDGWVLGERTDDAGAWLVIAEARKGAPDRVHRVWVAR